jgi:hypothetical protein
MYECVLCNFSSDRSTDLNRHKQTKKHIINEFNELKKVNDANKIIIADELSFCYQNDNKNTLNSKQGLLNDKNDKSCDESKTQNNAILLTTKENDNKKRHKCICGKVFSHMSGLSRHRKVCDGIECEKDKYIIKLETQLEEMKNRIEKIEQSNNSTTSNNNSHNSTNITDSKIYSDNTVNNKIINKTINVFTYLNTYYNDAKPIKMLESDDITRILTNVELGKHLLEDVIVFQQSKYALNEFLGEFILKEFKKSDPKTQQFWITDITRLKFVVRQALNQNDAVWHPDKKGVCLTKHIITPILNEIFVMMTDYKELCDERMKEATPAQYEKIHNQSKNAVSVIYDINQKILHGRILTYIAPYFQLELNDQDL